MGKLMDGQPTASSVSDEPPSAEPQDDRRKRVEALEQGYAEMVAHLGEFTSALKVIGARLDAKADAAALERIGGEIASALKGIDAKLDAKADAAALERVGGEIRVAFSDLRGILVGKASATDVASLKGEVGKLKGTGALIALVLGFLGGAAALAYTLTNYLRP